MNMKLVKSMFWASRPVSWINTAYPFGAAYYFTTQQLSPTLVLGSLFFLIPYNLLMYGINDVFDYESDILNPRKGGVEGATHKKEQLHKLYVAVLIVTIPASLAMLLLGDWVAKLVFVYLMFMVFAYSMPRLRFKERPFLDSFTSSTHFTSPFLYALVLSGWHAEYWPFVLALFLWGMASHAFGAVQDVIPDREAGIGSIATVIGAAHTVRFAAVLYLLSFLLLLPVGIGPAIVGACNFFYIANIAPYLSVSERDSHRANTGWKRFLWLNMISGFIVTLVLIVALR